MASFVEVAPGLVRLGLVGFDIVNVYLLGDVLVDAGPTVTTRRLLHALAGRRIGAVALTHAHFDHQGASHAVCQTLGVPLWCGEAERAAVEDGDFRQLMPDPGSLTARIHQRIAGPPHPVARTLREGDDVGGFTVLETPGHTAGHLSFFRESDRALVLGDALISRHSITLRKGLQEPFRPATWDLPRNRASVRRAAALEPSLVCFGHGPPLRDPGAFSRFASALPRD